MRRYLLATSALAGAGALLVSQPAHAQSQPPQPGSPPPPLPAAQAAPNTSAQVGEVVVTAQRRNESLSRVGETVNAVGASELARQGITSPQDLTKDVPGLQATTSYGGNPVYTLRGVGFSTQNVNATAPVGIYVDEASVPYPYMSNGVLFDLQRVEVLKGPQGTLYGRNATGGLIDFVTAKPTDHFAAGGSAEAGNYSTFNFTGYISGPVNDWLRLRLAGSSDNRFEGWQESVTRDEHLGKLFRDAVRLTADIGNGGPFSAEVTATYWRQTGDTLATQAIYFRPAGSPFATPAEYASVISHPTSDTQADWLSKSNQPEASFGIDHLAPITRSDFASITMKASYDVSSEIKLVSLTTYDYLHHHDVNDASGLQTEDIYQDAAGNIGSVSQELRVVGDFKKLSWSAGAYYAYDYTTENDLGFADQNVTIATLRYLALTIPQTRYTPQQIEDSFGNFYDIGDTQTTVEAVFANADYKFNDLIKLTLGGRYTQDKTSFQGCTYDYQGHNVPVVNIDYPILTGTTFNLTPNHCYTVNAAGTDFVNNITNAQAQDNFAWRSVLDITPSRDVLIYGSISRGYKAGGFPVLAGNSINQFNPVQQEELTAYEVGAKLALFDRRVQLNASTFYYDYVDKQVYGFIQDLIFGTLSRIENVPKSHEYGIEGDVTWRIIPTLTATAAMTYLDSVVDHYQGYDDLGNQVNFKGRPFAYTPKYQGDAALVYDAPLTQTLRSNASVNVSYQSREHADFAGLTQFDIKSYVLVDGTLGIASPAQKWKAALFVNNLFNTYYWTGVGTTTDTVFRYPGMPREFGVRVSYTY